ncbi:MAG TPA: hypothetical protein VN414_02600 [Methanosarcina sp.]|nr:hypothetical protein [Methanosarcina sp.]
MTKLCPLRPNSPIGNRAPDFAACLEEQCAWFDNGECAVKPSTGWRIRVRNGL